MATLAQIVDHLSGVGIQAVSKTVAADIELLEQFGIDVICVKSTQNRYFIGSRVFELPEIKMLIDAVHSASFLSEKQTQKLVEEMGALVSLLSSMIGNQYYVISDYGKQWMTEHEMEYDWYNDDEEMPFAAYKVLRSKKGTHEIEKDRCLKTIQTDAKSFGRYDYDTLIEILKAEGNMREVVICYLKELLIDMSGALNYDSWRRGGFDSEIIEMCNTIVFTPHLVKMFPRIKDYYEPSMIDEAYNLKLPVNACSRDDFKDIAEIMFDGTMDTDTMKGYQRRLSKKLIEVGAKM